MNKMNFSEEDKKKLVEFLNKIAAKATFQLNTVELIEYFKLLSYMQQTLLPKIEANILEIQKVIEPEENKEEPKSKKAK